MDGRARRGAIVSKVQLLGPKRARGNEVCRHPWGGRFGGHPWRALKRGLSLLITNTRPRRLTTCEPGIFFIDLIELRTFTATSDCY